MAVVATIRPACDGIFGPCVAVEEGTTNLIASSIDFQSGWATYGGAVVTVTPGEQDPFGGVNGYRVQTSGGTATLKYYRHLETGTLNQPYAVSVYVFVPPGAPTVRVSMQYGQVADVVAGSGWQRVELSAVGDGVVAVQLRFESLNIADSLDFYAYGPQIEYKSFATSFVDGTRGDGRLYYSLEQVLKNRSAWTVALWLRPLGLPSSGQIPVFWNIGTYSNPTTEDYHYFGLVNAAFPSAAKWHAADRNGYSSIVSTTTQLQPGQDYLIALVWDKSGANTRYLYVNGVLEASQSLASYSNDVLCTGLPEFWVGHYSYTNYPPNALYSNLLVLPYAASADTIKEWYDLRKPFYEPSPQIVVPRPTNVGLTVA